MASRLVRVDPVHAFYKHSRIKQCRRTGGSIFACHAGWYHLPYWHKAKIFDVHGKL